MRYERICYNVDVMRQFACLVDNPITVNNFSVLFNCTPVGRGSDSTIVQHKAKYLVGWGWTLVCFLAHRGSTSGLLLLQCFSDVADAYGTSRCLNAF